VDKAILIKEVRKLIGNVPTNVPLLVVTDQELTPPPSWNYIIWDHLDKEPSFIVSIKPTDPRYWGLRSTRLPAIKQRVRAACCSAVGQMLGFSRCSNPACFLYKPVESVSNLDEMSHLGREHKEPKLSGMGYRPEQDERSAVKIASLVRFEPEQ
jgi:predicted Zn-dependent protease